MCAGHAARHVGALESRIAAMADVVLSLYLSQAGGACGTRSRKFWSWVGKGMGRKVSVCGQALPTYRGTRRRTDKRTYANLREHEGQMPLLLVAVCTYHRRYERRVSRLDGRKRTVDTRG